MNEVQILVQEYKQQLADINEERNIYLAKCAILQKEKAELNKQIDELKAETTELKARVAELTPKVDEEQEDI